MGRSGGGWLGTPPSYGRFLRLELKVISIVTSIHCCSGPLFFFLIYNNNNNIFFFFPSFHLNLCTRNDAKEGNDQVIKPAYKW